MPTYDYLCEKCGHRFEAFQSITASPIKKCPACKASRVKRLIGTGAGVIFKGSGFYCTDYRKGGTPKPAAGESKSESKAEPPRDCSKCPKGGGSGEKRD